MINNTMCNFCTKKNLLNERMWEGISQKLVMGFEKWKVKKTIIMNENIIEIITT